MDTNTPNFSTQMYLDRIAVVAVHATVDHLLSETGCEDSLVSDLKGELTQILQKGAVVSGGKHSDFRFNLLIPVMRKIQAMVGDYLTQNLNPPSLAKILEQKILEADHRAMIGDTHIAKIYVNLNLSTRFLLRNALELAIRAGNSELPELFDDSETPHRVVMDYSSPNVAKEMHVGHLRSTIIGDSLYRLMSLFIPKDRILCLNHIGDWGTQFGMIINYLRFVHTDFVQIMEFLAEADAASLLKVYRSSKICFDNKDNDPAYATFADDSRHQTYCLQQGQNSPDAETRQLNEQNLEIWSNICRISSIAYNGVYSKLGIAKELTERGESFYNPIIPEVLEKIRANGLIEEVDGAQMIRLDGWDCPLIVVKSDGGYTYATTDLTAIYHRIFVEGATKIIYITDRGQESHFHKVFAVARAMGWADKVELTHIGFGLVSGPDGKKLKTRSGDTVKLVDVIDEVTGISKGVIEDRAKRAKAGEDVHDGYASVTPEQIAEMADKIGINTLKYYDLSFLYQSNYRYDANKMFEFQGDTGVYQMYAFCRILSIIDKSSYTLEDTTNNGLDLLYALDQHNGDPKALEEFKDLTQIDRDLMFVLSQFTEVFEKAYRNLAIKPVMDYVYTLTTQFARFVSKQNVKIIDADTQKFRVTLCALSYYVLDLIFDTIGMGKIEFI
jgi:arginyl-tRNA synthetase